MKQFQIISILLIAVILNASVVHGDVPPNDGDNHWSENSHYEGYHENIENLKEQWVGEWTWISEWVNELDHEARYEEEEDDEEAIEAWWRFF